LLLGAASFGGVLGAVLTSRISRRLGAGPTYIPLGCLLFPAPLVLVPLAHGSRVVVFGCLFFAEFGSGFGVMLLDIMGGAIKAALVPDCLRARVSGAYMVVNYGVRPVGALVGGALGTAIGLRPTLWIATTGAIAGFLFLLPSPIPASASCPRPTREPGLSVDVALDGSGVADLRLVGVEAGAAASPALVQQVPALVEFDLQLPEAFVLGRSHLLVAGPFEQQMLLVRHLVDPVDEALVLHARLPSDRSLAVKRSPPGR